MTLYKEKKRGISGEDEETGDIEGISGEDGIEGALEREKRQAGGTCRC